jgi:hypothetical protein
VASLLIRFRRPPSVSEADLPAWVARRVRVPRPALPLTWLRGTDLETLLVRVVVPASPVDLIEERMAELMVDPRQGSAMSVRRHRRPPKIGTSTHSPG